MHFYYTFTNYVVATKTEGAKLTNTICDDGCIKP